MYNMIQCFLSDRRCGTWSTVWVVGCQMWIWSNFCRRTSWRPCINTLSLSGWLKGDYLLPCLSVCLFCSIPTCLLLCLFACLHAPKWLSKHIKQLQIGMICKTVVYIFVFSFHVANCLYSKCILVNYVTSKQKLHFTMAGKMFSQGTWSEARRWASKVLAAFLAARWR